MRLPLRNLWLVCLLLSPSHAWAGNTETSTTTLTIDPSAVSGTTITASDENDRSNDASTWANVHVHSLANTTSVGNNAAGDKNLCFDAADSTDMCVRFDDTNNLLLVDSPTAATFGQIATISSTSGLSPNRIVRSNGTAGLLTYTSADSADDQALVADSATAATWRTIPNCTDATGNHLNYTQSTNAFSCGTSVGSSGTSLTLSTVAPATPAADTLYADSIVRAWANIDGDAVPASLLADVNVTSITDNGVGDITVTWDLDFATANYAFVCSLQSPATSTRVCQAISSGQSVGSVRLRITDDTNTLTDAELINIIAIGDN